MNHGVKRQHLSEASKAARIERDRAKIANYRALTQTVLDLHHNEVYTNEAFDHTTKLLDLNPEFYTVWNFRRDIISGLNLDNKSKVDLLNQELVYVMSLLKRYPKCYWIWTHRRWCLFELLDLESVNWEYEFKTVSKLLELDSRNFHGWQYRRFVVEQMELEKSKNSPDEESRKSSLLSLLSGEFEYTTNKINQNISNFSAWHNRSKLIPRLLEISNDPIFNSPFDILVHELELVKTGMFMDSEDTSVWTYLAWLLTDPIFTESLKSSGKYQEVLKEQLKSVEELNELEKEDEGKECVWCLRTMVMIKNLLDGDHKSEIERHLRVLMEVDPLRRGRYVEQISQ